jgi:hypothetical protein
MLLRGRLPFFKVGIECCLKRSDGRTMALRLEALSIVPRRQSGKPDEDLPERTNVFVTDFPGDLVERLLARFEHFTCFADPKMLAILGRAKTRRLLESTKKCPFLQTRALSH